MQSQFQVEECDLIVSIDIFVSASTVWNFLILGCNSKLLVHYGGGGLVLNC